MQNTKKTAVRADLICRNVPRNAQEQALMDASPSADCSLNAPVVTDSRTVASVRRIARHETTQRSAEIYQNRLYSRFDYVRLVDWPRFSSTGTFIWEVAKPLNT